MNKTIIPSFRTWWEEENDLFQAVLLDLDGTLTSGGDLLPGADQLVHSFIENEVPFLALTNDCGNSHEEKSQLLKSHQIPLNADRIVSCGDGIRNYVRNRDLEGSTFFLLGHLGTPCYGEAAGLRILRDPNQISECTGILMGDILDPFKPDLEVIFNYLIDHPDYPVVVANPDPYAPYEGGYLRIESGAVVRFLAWLLKQHGNHLDPVFLGKPHRAIFQFALESLENQFLFAGGLNPSRVLMLGDSLQSDIRGANGAGLSSALILTGITREVHLKSLSPEEMPSYIFRNM